MAKIFSKLVRVNLEATFSKASRGGTNLLRAQRISCAVAALPHLDTQWTVVMLVSFAITSLCDSFAISPLWELPLLNAELLIKWSFPQIINIGKTQEFGNENKVKTIIIIIVVKR